MYANKNNKKNYVKKNKIKAKQILNYIYIHIYIYICIYI